MLRVALFTLLAPLVVFALDLHHVQAPLISAQGRSRNETSTTVGEYEPAKWRLEEIPGPDVTDHLVFETVYSLLQHWPNIRMRNGHNIVPGTIPKGTTLYHGTSRKQLPPGPEWVAMDPEYAYYFCWDSWSYYFRNECWYLTLATTRSLKIVYFDGSSSSKFPNGSLDSQELIAWGESRPDLLFEERKRIKDLCEWAQNFDLDGIDGNVIVMLCDFTSGVSTVSFVNLETPKGVFPMMSGFTAFEVINAGSQHNHLPGETRIHLDLPGLVSFYDTRLVPSLVSVRAGQERWDHRVANISKEDLSALKTMLEATLTGPSPTSSGIDWKTLFQVVIDRFSGRFEFIQYLLNAPVVDLDGVLDLANKTQTQLRIILTPYILLSAAPADPSNEADVEWTIPIFKHCATTDTYTLESGLDSMTWSEKLFLQAIRGTSREICRVVIKMWTAGVYAGIDHSLNAKETLDMDKIIEVRSQWAEDLNRLMAWLDWNVWVKCKPECGPEEICYLPTWPINFPGFPEPSDPGRKEEKSTGFDFRAMAVERVAKELSNNILPEPDEWVRPHPKCIRRVDPYEF